MKNAAVMETPDSGAASATPEMFAHEWDLETGDCKNAETVVVGLAKGRKATVFLGCMPDKTWRAGWFAELVSGDEVEKCRAMGKEYMSRDQALIIALGVVLAAAAEGKDKQARKALEAFITRTFPERSPANKETEAIPTPTPAEVALEAVEANPNNPRKEFPEDYIDELAASLQREGLLQRIGVRLMPADASATLPGVEPAPRYRLLYGECRLRASRKLGWTTIRAEVYPASLSLMAERRIIQVENLKRRNLNPIEEANGYADLARDFNLTQDEIAKEVGKSRPVVANALRLLELPEAVRELLASGALTAAHGTALCRFKEWPEACSKIAELAVKNRTPAGQLEKNLPFGEELAKAGLAVDIHEHSNSYYLAASELKKKFGTEPGVFAWSDSRNYETQAYDLDLARGAELVEKQKKKAAEEEARYSSRRSGGERDESGELTPAAKRERQKKIDGNLENRLAVSAIGDAAFKRLKAVKDVDALAVAVVAAEAMAHCGDVDELAERLGIKLPKGFDGYDPACVAELDPVDALRLAAASIAHRETQDAMRYAAKPREDVLLLAKKKDEDAEKLVADWKENVKQAVASGLKPEQIAKDLECPEFLAVNLSRVVKRETREAAEKASKAGLTDSMRELIRSQLAGGPETDSHAHCVAKMYAVPIQWVNQVRKDRQLDEAAKAASLAPANAAEKGKELVKKALKADKAKAKPAAKKKSAKGKK